MLDSYYDNIDFCVSIVCVIDIYLERWISYERYVNIWRYEGVKGNNKTTTHIKECIFDVYPNCKLFSSNSLCL